LGIEVMRKELDETLCAKYPEIFRDRHGDMRSTAMCWGFECGDGWYNIIDSACAAIQNHIDNEHRHVKFLKKWNEEIKRAHAGDWSFLYEQYTSDQSRAWLEENLEKEKKKYLIELREVPEPFPQVFATQVKEKYGTLRFYLSHEDEYISGVIAMAEYLSGAICETCGAPGKSRDSGWTRTLCDEHAKEYE
jgi:hypothetical protein